MGETVRAEDARRPSRLSLRHRKDRQSVRCVVRRAWSSGGTTDGGGGTCHHGCGCAALRDDVHDKKDSIFCAHRDLLLHPPIDDLRPPTTNSRDIETKSERDTSQF
jgi:hypothetical protein